MIAGKGHAFPMTAPERRILATVMMLAIIARVTASIPHLVHHPDELWQYLEAANFIVDGTMVRAWEYRTGIRSWLIPLFLTPPLWLGKLISPDGDLYIWLARAWMVTLSLPAVAAATLLGFRSSRLHGLIMGLVAALWFEFVYFAPRPLSESVALALVVPAACLLAAEPGRNRLRIAGLLLGLALMARYQLVPLIGVLALFAGRLHLRTRWWPMVQGGINALLLSAAADLAMGQPPFHWMVLNFQINFLEDKSSAFGVSPWYGYATLLWNSWSWATLLLLPLALLGARRYPAFLVAALANIALHSLVPHKEYRFIVPSVALLLLLAAWGSATMLQRLRRQGRATVGPTGAALAGLWLAAAALVMVQPHQWKRQATAVSAQMAIGEAPGMCGLALIRPAPPLIVSHYYIGRAEPIYSFRGSAAWLDAVRGAAAYNRVIARRQDASILPPGYRILTCPADWRWPSGQFCAFARPGRCSARLPASYGINAHLAELGI